MSDRTAPFRSGFVAIIGRPNVGKSTLLNCLVGEKIAITTAKPQTTRNRILGIHTDAKAQILFVDTPGIHRARSALNRYMVDVARSACLDVDVILWLVEADRAADLDPLIPQIIGKSRARLVLGINKIDLVAKDRLLPLIDAYRKVADFTAVVPISAVDGSGTGQLLETMIDLLPEGPRYFPDDQITDLPERFIVAEMIREQVLLRTRDEVPYGVAVLVERFEENPGRNMVGIDAVICVERESHKGILIGRRGAMIRQVGQAARREIEALLGVKVYLELFIKVEKNWTESGRKLKEFGFDGP